MIELAVLIKISDVQNYNNMSSLYLTMGSGIHYNFDVI